MCVSTMRVPVRVPVCWSFCASQIRAVHLVNSLLLLHGFDATNLSLPSPTPRNTLPYSAIGPTSWGTLYVRITRPRKQQRN